MVATPRHIYGAAHHVLPGLGKFVGHRTKLDHVFTPLSRWNGAARGRLRGRPMRHMRQSRPRLVEGHFTVACALPTFAFASNARKATTCGFLSANTSATRNSSRFESAMPSTGKTAFHGPPSTWYSARRMIEVASAARKTISTFGPLERGAPAVTAGGVLSSSIGSVSCSSMSDCEAGFEASSDATILKMYRPSGSALGSTV